MKKAIAAIVVLLLIGMFLSGCSENVKTADGQGRLRIYTSFYPMYFLASEIAGDKAEVISMVPAGAEPHDWEPTPRMIIELNEADMLIYNGAGMEAWIDKILPGIDKERTKVVDASEGIELLKSGEQEYDGVDPHIWVSPLRAMQQAQTIYEALKEVDPENSDYYGKNKLELDSKLSKLDKDIRDAVKSFKSDLLVVSHAAFGYFAKDYNLRQVPIRGINPKEEPSPSKMGELVKICRQNNVKYVFFEQFTSSKLSEAIANDAGAGTLVLSDAAGLSEKDINSGKDYMTVMYENLENLKKALGD